MGYVKTWSRAAKTAVAAKDCLNKFDVKEVKGVTKSGPVCLAEGESITGEYSATDGGSDSGGSGGSGSGGSSSTAKATTNHAAQISHTVCCLIVSLASVMTWRSM